MKLNQLQVVDSVVNEEIPPQPPGMSQQGQQQPTTATDPAARALAAKQQRDQKEALRQEIQLTQSELQRNQEKLRDLRKQLAQS